MNTKQLSVLKYYSIDYRYYNDYILLGTKKVSSLNANIIVMKKFNVQVRKKCVNI